MSIDAPTRLKLEIAVEAWELASPFRITGYTFTDSKVVVVRLSDGAETGIGEACGVYYRGETVDSMVAEIEAVRDRVEAGLTTEALREVMAPGGARNAVDAALWDLESRRRKTPIWSLAGLERPSPLLTTCTLGADTPEIMADGAVRKYPFAKAIKLKLIGDGGDAARVQAVRDARPDVWIGVDANQGFTPETLKDLMPTLLSTDVKLIEQPFKIGQEALMDGLNSPIPTAADESVQNLKDVAGLVGRFDVMNIKLDKCGGLTEGLMMAREGQRLGLKIMVGNMTGTSLSMAPGILIGQFCDVVDLDGPLFLKSDRTPAVTYDEGKVALADGLWGWSAA